MPVSFLDDPVGERGFGECGPYQLLSEAELVLPMARADLSELMANELEPATVGEAMFNFWD
ncbi:hypothetical protein [Streptosporangium sp. CA-115845]|uniref:hypothetical protein n=1 Tax=Streptosporangium sp. CA-115845 TaxID=3240071 RepID=UPI003D917FC6